MENRKEMDDSRRSSNDDDDRREDTKRRDLDEEDEDLEDEYEDRNRSDPRDDRREDSEEDEKEREDRKEDHKEDHKEDNKDEELKPIEEIEREPLLQKNIVFERERSYVLPHRERAVIETQILHMPDKSELVRTIGKNENQFKDKNRDFLRKLEQDGIYKIGAVSEDMVTSTLTKPMDLSLRQGYRTNIKSAIL